MRCVVALPVCAFIIPQRCANCSNIFLAAVAVARQWWWQRRVGMMLLLFVAAIASCSCYCGVAVALAYASRGFSFGAAQRADVQKRGTRSHACLTHERVMRTSACPFCRSLPHVACPFVCTYTERMIARVRVAHHHRCLRRRRRRSLPPAIRCERVCMQNANPCSTYNALSRLCCMHLQVASVRCAGRM